MEALLSCLFWLIEIFFLYKLLKIVMFNGSLSGIAGTGPYLCAEYRYADISDLMYSKINATLRNFYV